MVKKSVSKDKRNAPMKVAAKRIKRTTKEKPVKLPVAQPQQPQMISNEAYMLQVMTDRCKTLEVKVITLAQEVTRLRTKYETDGPAKADKTGDKDAA
jgi:hypothetical protein